MLSTINKLADARGPRSFADGAGFGGMLDAWTDAARAHALPGRGTGALVV